MKDNSTVVLISIVLAISVTLLSGAALAAGSTDVTVAPDDSELTVDESQTFDINVENADGGVGGYEFNANLSDASVGEITNVELAGDPGIKDVQISDDGSSVAVEASLADTNDTGMVTITSITVAAQEPGTSELDLSVAALGDESGASYTVNNVENGQISVSEEPDVGVALEPNTITTPTGRSDSQDIVVTNVSSDIGAHGLNFSLDNATVATIQGVTLNGDPGTEDISISDDGKTVNISAALLDLDGGQSTTLATVNLAAESPGTTTTDLTVDSLGDTAGNTYETTDPEPGKINVTKEEPAPDVSGNDKPATDPDKDGVYEDVNGDGSANTVDVQAFFANLESDAVQENVELFDFNGDGKVNTVDVQKLFNIVR